jgi:hypothetical protein
MNCPHCGGLIKTRRQAKRERVQAKRDADATVRATVMRRAANSCECCGTRGPMEMDHFYGRARDRSPAGCLLLCRSCHENKTMNRPSRAWWLSFFRSHLVAHSFPTVRVDALIAKNAGKRRTA